MWKIRLHLNDDSVGSYTLVCVVAIKETCVLSLLGNMETFFMYVLGSRPYAFSFRNNLPKR